MIAKFQFYKEIEIESEKYANQLKIKKYFKQVKNGAQGLLYVK